MARLNPSMAEIQNIRKALPLSTSPRDGAKKTLDYTNEGLGFSLPLATNYEETLREFVESESMSMGETYFMGSANDKGPFMVVVEMRC